jgi:hypothetical protein
MIDGLLIEGVEKRAIHLDWQVLTTSSLDPMMVMDSDSSSLKDWKKYTHWGQYLDQLVWDQNLVITVDLMLLVSHLATLTA